MAPAPHDVGHRRGLVSRLEERLIGSRAQEDRVSSMNPPGNGILCHPEALAATHQYARNVSLWLAGLRTG